MNAVSQTVKAPIYDVDLYSDEAIANPYPHYRAMRDLGPVVSLPRNGGAYAITRFSDVRDALRRPDVFISGRGVMMSEEINAAAAGTSILTTDNPVHDHLRKIMAKPLSPAALKPLKEDVQVIADDLVETLIARGSFDGVTDFAHILPLTLVARMVGLPEDGREQMLEWANGIFNSMGPLNARCHDGTSIRLQSQAYLGNLKGEDLLPGSWGARVFDLADQGEITDSQARSVLFSYVAPALDTTINATSSAIWLFGQNPDQWDVLRAEPSLISASLDEAIRLESPIRAFSRYLTTDHEVDGVFLPAGSRVLIVYASANRDERRWDDPERFDIRRRTPQEQLGFGTGIHMCPGMHLAKLEMRCLFEALLRRVRRFEVTAAHRDLHNVLRGLTKVQVNILELDSSGSNTVLDTPSRPAQELSN